MTFKSRMELEEFIRLNIPIMVAPKGKSKYKFVSPFSSHHAYQTVINGLTDRLYEKLNETIK
jgi:hypothetical protein